jgi:nucleoside-diphosphate-sugar epimerase
MWLLLGGSGFIGTNFARFLLENDYSFKIYDKQKSKYLPKGVKTVIGDVRDKNKLSKSMKGCETVFHLVTVPPSIKITKEEIYDIDVNGTQNVLLSAIENDVEKVIFTSSASHVYGLVKNNSCPLQENSTLNPINEYGRNKVVAEDLCKKATEKSILQTIVLRLSMVLGPYNFDPILIENMKSILRNKRVIIPGDGRSRGQSVHVQDVNSALLKSAEKTNTSLSKHEIINISGEEILTLDEYIELLRNVTGSTSKIIHLPLPLAKSMTYIAWRLNKTNVHPSYLSLMAQDQYFDIRKAKNILDWQPKYTIKKAMEDTIAFFKKDGCF